ncbi:MAG: hypothetical protein LBU08_00355, partial [Tannerellaceae bacterium]|nr:hypothetical protein [Tannerellaceae bacterium]
AEGVDVWAFDEAELDLVGFGGVEEVADPALGEEVFGAAERVLWGVGGGVVEEEGEVFGGDVWSPRSGVFFARGGRGGGVIFGGRR